MSKPALAMTRAAMRRAALLACVLVSRVAAADRITVKVIEVAGDTAYLAPGRAAGLVPGVHVKIGGRDLVVIESTDKTASVTVDGTAPPFGGAAGRAPVPAGDHVSLSVGQTGTADVTSARADRMERMPAPKPLEEFKEQWPAAQRPAERQQVTPVPLGEQTTTGTNHLAMFANMFGNADKAGTGGQIELRGVGSANAIEGTNIGADLDGSLRLYDVGYNAEERTPVLVRAAQLRYGDANDPSFVVGRLRYAAASLGMLDGARVNFHTGAFEIGTFGGLLPSPLSGHPSTAALLVGAETIWDDTSSSWQPRVAVTAHGSTWNGQLDERVVQLTAQAHHGSTLLDAWADVQNFDSTNPWHAPIVDLTGAGATAEWRDHGDHLGIDFTFMRPERSLRLMAALPPDWLCARAPQPGNVAETCIGEDYWMAATASAGVRRTWWSVDAVASVGETQSVTVGYDASGYVRAEIGSRQLRAIIAPAFGHDSFGAWVASDFGVATSLTPHIDADLTYRPEQLDYVASTGAFFEQSLVTDVRWNVSRTTDFALAAVGTIGNDGDVLTLLTTIAWRPLR
jgi:hypothetical protein